MFIHDYRPDHLAELAMHPNHRKLVRSYLQEEEIPHLLLVGPPGTGKTTLTEILEDRFGWASLRLNASDDRGIDVIRGRVKNFARVVTPFTKGGMKLIVLDEADGLTPQAQQALRTVIEDYAHNTRFILIANDIDKVHSALQSRCTTLDMSDPPPKERKTALWHVLAAAEAEFDHEALEYFAHRYSDVRTLVNEAEKSVKIHGRLTIPPGEEAA